MAITKITGRAIRNETIETNNIKNGTILKEDLAAEVTDALNEVPVGGTGILDPFHQSVSKAIEESTTGIVWLTYLTLTTTSIDAGQYRIMASYTNRVTDDKTPAEFKLVLDGSDILFEHSTRNAGFVSDKIPTVDFTDRALSGIHTIDLQYRTVQANKVDIFMQKARIELKRITL